ncbi:MAG: alpha-xylosidase [Clostridiales bacterium]|nr:alpha-xylosidase [Clostridiales bacterium]
MKFSDGFWMNKPGYEVAYATQPYEFKVSENSIKVFVTKNFIQNRGMTLEGPVLEVTFTSTLADTIKVSIDHYSGTVKKTPSFKLYEDATFKPEICETETHWEMTSGKTKVRILKVGGWDVQYFYEDKLITKQGWRTTSYIQEASWITENRMKALDNANFFAKMETDENVYMRDMLNVSVGEHIYGFGEKFSTFVKNGQTVDVWNNDGGTCTEQTYKSIPFYVSSNNYGVFVNHPEKVSFEVASETVSKVAFSVQGEHLEYFVIGGKTIADVLSVYTTLTGKPGLPPAYSYGLWLTTSFTTNYDEETCSYFIDEMEKRDIPLEVFHFDCFWMKEFNWTDFTWDKRMFPDPKAMLSRLKKKNVEICVWINPYISQQSALFDEGVEKGYFIKKHNGDVFQADMWQPGMAIVDFTNPDAVKWYQSFLRDLCEMGVNAFKTDFGERIPTDVVYFDGSDPHKMHNYYTQLYNKAVFEVLEDFYGKGQACLFARSATVGGQQFPVHWGGDCFSQYESMAETLRGGLSLCLSGFGFFSHDISGFEATGTPDLYKRWSAFGLMSTHSRLHGNSSYRVPWNFDEESVDVVRHFTKLKGKLMPYLFAMGVKAHEVGVPMMRAMVVDFSNDPATHALDRQYMLGDNLLVAPIFNEEGTAQYYVPAGKWTDIQTGEVFEGGRWYETKHDYLSMPLLAKPNSIIGYGEFKRNFAYDYLENAEFVIYQLEDGKSAQAVVYDKEANREFTLNAERNGDVIKITHTATDKKFTVRSAEGLKVEF